MPKTRSRNSEDERLKLLSTPFEARLEKALEIGVAERHDEVSAVLQVTEWIKQAETKKPISESKEKLEEPNSGSTEREVSFDLNVKTNEEVNVNDNLVKTSKEKEEGEEVHVFDNLVENKEKEGSEKREDPTKETKLDSDSSTPTEIPHVSNHRYQNCASSEDEIEDLDLEECEVDDVNSDGDDKKLFQAESSESLFSLSIESRKQFSEVESGEKEVNSSPMPIHCANPELEEIGLSKNARDRSQFVHSVLSPVENLSQWKVVKARATPPVSKYQDKENISLVQNHDVPTSPEPNVKLLTHNAKLNFNNKVVEQEIAVDTSLSSWLVESETTPMSNTSSVSVGNSPSQIVNSSRSHEDKPVLGALTVEELKQLSGSITPQEPFFIFPPSNLLIFDLDCSSLSLRVAGRLHFSSLGLPPPLVRSELHLSIVSLCDNP
ncbi:hypothetical protein Patl1_23149 [Pistacia atlantica]|uniref:Uncharacterized protein n=1 Tax=Pistacia atlantica TaxID=434234 RepID=A0ACC0ZZB8_9ROSI|nr:hypothetical protein Patl1_23149 [Pistacia atlantica]